jgi:hypothetical protein
MSAKPPRVKPSEDNVFTMTGKAPPAPPDPTLAERALGLVRRGD